MTTEEKEIYAEGLQVEALSNFLGDAISWHEDELFTGLYGITFRAPNGNTWALAGGFADLYIIHISSMARVIATGKIQVAINDNIFGMAMNSAPKGDKVKIQRMFVDGFLWSAQYANDPHSI